MNTPTPHAFGTGHDGEMLCISSSLLRGNSGLTRVELALLAFVYDHPDSQATRAEIARDCGCAANSVPRAAKKLVELGLIERMTAGCKATTYRPKRNTDVTVTVSERNVEVTRNTEVTVSKRNRNADVTIEPKQALRINERNNDVTVHPTTAPTPPNITTNSNLSDGGLGEGFALSAEPDKPKRRRKAPPIEANDDNMPAAMSAKMRARADDAGYLNGSGEALFREWRDNAIAVGKVIKNHDASFSTWVGRAPRYGNPPPRKSGNGVMPNPYIQRAPNG